MSDFWLTAAWLVTVFLFLLSAFFSSSETAIMSVNRLRLKSLVDQGDRRASCVDRLLGNSPRLLSGILLGNNFANVMLASLATAIAVPLWGEFAPLYVSPILTVLLLVFAEIVPKTLAAKKPLALARITAPPLEFFIRVTAPMIGVTTRLANILIRPFVGAEEGQGDEAVKPEDLVVIANVGREAGTLGPMTQNILHGAYEFSVTTVLDVMVPRHEMVSMSVEEGLQGFEDLVRKKGHTRIPVYRENDEDIIGILHAKDLLHRPGRPERVRDLEDILRPAVFVPEQTLLGRAIRRMQQSKSEMLFVVDEYGGLEGLVTLKDLVEELIGEIEDEHMKGRNRRIDVVRPGCVVADATISLRYLKRRSGIDLIGSGARTLGGLLVGENPGELAAGRQISWRGFQFTILSMSGRFLGRIRIDLPEQDED
ncbi:MAG: HlyC/CorC family transporter [Planctomycetes bacterium]|nr:HlyC/CorC family transporter [Planctomycetota bacterium]